MSEQTTEPHTEQDRSRLRPNAMGTVGLVFTIAATVGIMAAFMGASPIVFTMSGPATPPIYLLAALMFALFAVGYLAMARRSGNAAGFVAFITKGAGRRVGVAAAYVTLLTYTVVLTGLYGIYALFVQLAFIEFFGLDLPWGFWALITLAVLAVLSYNRVEFSMRVMGTLLALAVLAVLVMDVAILIQEAPNGFSFAGFTPEFLFTAGFGPAMLFALASFIGVESSAVYGEEVREPRKTIPRATYAAIAVIGAFYVISTFLVSAAVGVEEVAEVAADDPTGFIFAVAAQYVGPIWAQVLSVLVVTSFFAVVLGFTNVMSRYVFGLGRAGILPRVLGRSHKKHQSPHIASVATAILALVILLIFIVANADPFEHLYTWFLAVGTVGVLSLIFLCSIAVVIFFRRLPGEENIWKTLIAPALSTIVFAIAIVMVVLNFELFAGGMDFAQWLWVAVPVVAIAGFVVGSLPRFHDLDLDRVE